MKTNPQINWSNPLTRNLVACWILDGTIKGFSYLPMNLANPNIKLNYASDLTSTTKRNSTMHGLRFTGTDHIEINSYNNLNPINNMSIEVILKANAQPGKCAFAHWDSTLAKRSFFIGSGASDTNMLQVYISDDGTTNAGHLKRYESSISPFQEKLTHTLITFNGQTSTLKIYIDGQEDKNPNKLSNSVITSIFTSDSNLSVGCNLDNTAESSNYTGNIYRISMWNRTLSNSEAFLIYNNINEIYLN